MATDHPEWVHAAIRSLAQADVSGAEIRRRLARGAIPGKPAYDIPLRTVQEYAQRARQQLEPIGTDDIATANAIERSVLRIARADVHRLELKQRKSGLTKAEADTLRSHFTTIDAIRTARRRASGPAPDREAQERQGKAEDAKRRRPSTLIDRIARDLEQNGSANPAST